MRSGQLPAYRSRSPPEPWLQTCLRFPSTGSRQTLTNSPTVMAARLPLSPRLDAPPQVVAAGFFAVVRHWVERTPHLIHENWVPYRVTLLGNYCSGLPLRQEITQFLLREDPYGTQAFVQFGIDRGEVRTDIDAKMIVSLVDWLMDRCQDAIVTEELDPGLFGSAASTPAVRDLRVRQFVELLRGAIGARP